MFNTIKMATLKFCEIKNMTLCVKRVLHAIGYISIIQRWYIEEDIYYWIVSIIKLLFTSLLS